MCRTTFELTPGASQVATGGAAQQLLLQHSLEIDKPTDMPPHMMVSLIDKDPMENVIEKQQHQLEAQASTIAKLNEMMDQLKIQSINSALAEGSIESTGAVRVQDFAEQTVVPVAAPAAVSLEIAEENPTTETALTDATNSPMTEEAVTSVDQAPSAEFPSSSSSQSPAEEIFTPQQMDMTVTTSSPIVDDEPQQLVVAEVPQLQQPTLENAMPTEEITSSMNIQLAPATRIPARSAPVPYVDPAVLRDAAVQAVTAKKHRASSKDEVHQQASKWSQYITLPKNKGKRSLSHLKDINVLAQLDEGLDVGLDEQMQLWESEGLPGMPDDDFIDHLASVAYDAGHQSNPAVGLQSLVELDEGEINNGSPSDNLNPSAIRALAEKAAAAEFPTARSCVERDEAGKGICVLYDDGSRCLRTDREHALCGFVEGKGLNGDLKRNFLVMAFEKLLP
jgi:hypothetical protein